jgi:myo-inositol 2-dehydrogenase/D-chiro-inositol 1-dehydrogenase
MKKSQRVGIGIIGCGSISQWRHLPVLVGEMQEGMDIEYDNFKSPVLSENTANILGICDADEKRLALVGDRYGIVNRYSDYNELLKNKEIDAVIIAVPNEGKLAILRASAEMKKHIFLEKPMGSNLAEAKEIGKIVKKNNIRFAIGFNKRFYYGYRIAKKIIDEGGIGKIQGLYARLWIPLPNIETFSKEVGIHIYDLLYYFAGAMTEINSSCLEEKQNFTIGTMVKFWNKSIGMIMFSSNSEFWYPNERIEIIGDSGSALIIDNGQKVYKTSKTGPSIYWEPSLSVHWQTGNEIAGYTRELKDFINCIIKNEQPEAGIESGIHSLKIHEAVLESIKTKQAISIK